MGSDGVVGRKRQPVWQDFMQGIDTSKEFPSPQDWRELFLRKCAWVAQLEWEPPESVRRDLGVMLAYWATGGADPDLAEACADIRKSNHAAVVANEERDWASQVAAHLAPIPVVDDWVDNWSDYEMSFEGFLHFWEQMPKEYWPGMH